MSDDPWARYTNPKGAPAADPASAAAPTPPPAPTPSLAAGAAADAWSKYTAAAPTMAPTRAAAPKAQPDTATTSSYDPNWHGTGNAILDFLTRPRAKTEGVGAAVNDVGLSALDDLTFGYGPKAMGADKQAAQAHQNLGLIDYPVGAIAYGAGPGKILGPLARGAVGLTGAGGLGASIAAGGLEGGAAGAAGAAGHGGNIGAGAAMGALTGGAIGGLGGEGPTPKPPEVGVPQGASAQGVPINPTGLYAAKDAAYKPLDGLYFDTHGDAINRAQAAIRNVRDPQGKGAPLGIPPNVNSILTDSEGLANPEVTGRTIQEASRDLRATGDWTGHRYADALDNTLRYDTPTAGGQAGDAWAAKTQGDDLWGRIQGINRLTPDEGSPTLADIKQTKSFYDDKNSPEYQALDTLQSASGPGLNWWHLRHPLGALAFEGAAQGAEALDPDKKNPWLHAGLHAAAAASLFSGAPAALSAAGRFGQGSALNAARYAIGTGQPITTMQGRLGNTLLDLIAGRAASNQWPY